MRRWQPSRSGTQGNRMLIPTSRPLSEQGQLSFQAPAPTKPSELSKKEKNRLAARKCRAKKKQEESELMKRLRDTRSRLSQLRYEVYQLEEKRESLLLNDNQKRARHLPVADANVAAAAIVGAGCQDLTAAVLQLLSDSDVSPSLSDANASGTNVARGRAGGGGSASHVGAVTLPLVVAAATSAVATTAGDSFVVSSGVDSSGCASFTGMAEMSWDVTETDIEFGDTFGFAVI